MTTEVRRKVADAVRSALAASGHTERWLAARASIDRDDLRDKLTLRTDFTVTDLADIAVALGIPIATLFPQPSGDASRATDHQR
ncbi:hypothetical protein [Microbacterium sp. NPDC057944]|uniref:hypothetical protein n=1 Tax=Microbacterium sp. NPDC057944 TaxID=3346286 RepID=UPI0036DDB5B0